MIGDVGVAIIYNGGRQRKKRRESDVMDYGGVWEGMETISVKLW